MKKRFDEVGKKWSSPSGQSLVEFALVVPILAFLLFAIIQWGLIFNAYISVDHAANVTARSAAFSTVGLDLLDTAQKAMLPPLSGANITGTPTLSTVAITPAITAYQVTVSYKMPLIIPYVVTGPGPITTENGNKFMTITRSALYRKEGL